MTNLQRLLAALTAIVCITLAMSSCKPKSEPTKPTTTTEILQIKDFPYLKKETKMSSYTFEEIEAYEKNLGLRKQTKKTDTYVIY